MNQQTEIAHQQDKDWFLQSLINTVNGNDFELGITLTVEGFLISGYLVSGHKYFDGVAGDLTRGIGDEEAAQKIREAYALYGNIYTAGSASEAPPQPQPSYLHLREARFFNTSGAPVPDNQGVWWRGRVAEVAGFTIGVLSVDEDA